MPFGFGEAIDATRVVVRDRVVRTTVMDDTLWNRITAWQLGVAAVDPDGHKMGMNIAYRTGAGLNWYPADRYKQTLVGTVDRYGFYDGWGDEADWNIYIKPDPSFRFLIDDVLTNADLDDMHTCNNSAGYCMEAEITPDEHFYSNPYFNKNGSSNRVGQKIGVYGPWVMEEAHGWRPEIHPSEVLWWRDSRTSGGRTLYTWTVMVMQDDSNRFDRSGDFRGRIARPWSKVPRRAIIDIAVAVDPTRAKRITVRDVYQRNVGNSDPAGAATVVGSYAGAPVVTLDKSALTNRTYVGARFGAFKSVDSGASLHGFLRLNAEVGRNDRGGEGYLVLEIRETQG